MNKIRLLIVAGVGVAAACLAQPACMNYQGRLLDAGGQPLSNGVYAVEFNFYDSPAGTNRVWGAFLCDDGLGDGHSARAVIANGRFNVILGPEDTSSRPLTGAFQGDERFVEIKVNGGSPILPRQQVLSAPYAMRSHSAQQAASLVQELADALCPPGSILAFGGATNGVPSGWLLCDGSALASTNYARLFAAIGQGWGNGTFHQGVPEADPGTDFNVPDLRGVFLRGVNLGRADAFQDPNAASRTNFIGGFLGDQPGSFQGDGIQTHTHKWGWYNGGDLGSWTAVGTSTTALNRLAADQIPNGSGKDDDYMDVMNVTDGFWTRPYGMVAVAGSTETHPRNAYVNYIIKY